MTDTVAKARENNVEDGAAEFRWEIRRLLDALDEADLAALEAKYQAREELERAIADQAGKVTRRLAGGAEAVRPEEYRRLAAAMLTWGGQAAGVHQNTGHAVAAFQRFRKYPEVPPEVQARVTLRYEPLLPLVGATALVDGELRSRYPGAEPALFLTPLVTTVLIGRHLATDGAADVAVAVLDRGTELWHGYYNAGRSLPNDERLIGGVVGNADFLLQVAALRMALDEHLAAVTPRDPVAALEGQVRELAEMLARAMTRPEKARSWRTPDEPDVFRAFEHLAEYLGGAAGPAAPDVRIVYLLLTPWLRRLRLRVPAAVPRDWPEPLDAAFQAPDQAVTDLDHLLGWLVYALFAGVETADHQALLHWLTGRRDADTQDDIWLLVERLRAAVRVLRNLPADPPRAPVALPRDTYLALLSQLHRAGQQSDAAAQADRYVLPTVAGLLPALWTRRHAAIELIRSHVAVELGRHHAATARAGLVAACAVRGPAQFIDRRLTALPTRCCRACADGAAPFCDQRDRRAPGGPREVPPATEICPDRPWPEEGYVESYATLAEFAGYPSGDAVRKQLARYRGLGHQIVCEDS